MGSLEFRIEDLLSATHHSHVGGVWYLGSHIGDMLVDYGRFAYFPVP